MRHRIAALLLLSAAVDSAAGQSYPSKNENLAATDAYIKSEIRKWARVVQAAKITAE